MNRYFLRRLLLVVPTILGVTFIIFLLVRLIPGGVESVILGEHATPQQAAQVRHELGLDKPYYEQYATWIGHLVSGDFGKSVTANRSIAKDIKSRIGWTFELGAMALAFSMLVALPVGILSAMKQDSIWDFVARSMAIAFLAVPSFWLATLLIVGGSVGINLGFYTIHFTPPLGSHIGLSLSENLRLLVPPAIILGIGLSGSVMRLTRTQMLEVLRQDYVRTARAKGLQTRVVISRHALKNAFIPIVTIIGLQVPILVGGTVVLEQIFGLPGMGLYLFQAIGSRDFTIIQSVVVISATVVIVSNLLVDFTYSYLDPRIRAA